MRSGDKVVSLIENENHLYAGTVRSAHAPAAPTWRWELTIVFEDDDVRRVPAHWALPDRRAVVADDGAIRVTQETIVLRPDTVDVTAEWPLRHQGVEIGALRRVRCLAFHSSLHLHQSAVLLDRVPIPHRCRGAVGAAGAPVAALSSTGGGAEGADAALPLSSASSADAAAAAVPVDTASDDPLAIVQGGIFRRDLLMYEVHQCMVIALPLVLGARGDVARSAAEGRGHALPGGLRLAFLGGGAGTAPMAAACCFAAAQLSIDVVEIDAGVMGAACAHFGLTASPALRLHVADAEEWLRATPNDALDVILMDCAAPDADEDAAIEAPLAVFISPSFLNGEVRRALTPGGFYVANIIANDVAALLEAVRVFDACFDEGALI